MDGDDALLLFMVVVLGTKQKQTARHEQQYRSPTAQLHYLCCHLRNNVFHAELSSSSDDDDDACSVLAGIIVLLRALRLRPPLAARLTIQP